MKNFKTRCEGLSPALFYFAIFGNITYALSICAKSIDIEYLLANAAWLAGMSSEFTSSSLYSRMELRERVDGSSGRLREC